MPAMRRTMRNLLTIGVLAAFASCGNLTCSQDKKDSIKHQNLGVDALKSRTWSVAQKELEKAVDLDPENHVAAYHLGEAFMGEKKYDKAAGAYLKAIKYNDKDPMYHYKLAKAYYEAQQWDQARQEFEKALSINNRLYKAHWHLGRIHKMQDRPKEAAQAWTEACRLDPGFGKPFYDLGLLYFQWDHIDQSISVLEQGAQYARDPEDKTNIYYQLGMGYAVKKEWDKAIGAYDAAIKAKSDNLEARLMLGMAYADKGDKANAKKWLDDFIKLGGGGNAFNIQNAHERLLLLASQ